MVIKKSQHIKDGDHPICVAKMTPSLLRDRLTLKMIRIHDLNPEFASFICWTSQHLQLPRKIGGFQIAAAQWEVIRISPWIWGSCLMDFCWFVKKRWPNDLSRIVPHINQANQSLMFDLFFRLRKKKKPGTTTLRWPSWCLVSPHKIEVSVCRLNPRGSRRGVFNMDEVHGLNPRRVCPAPCGAV